MTISDNSKTNQNSKPQVQGVEPTELVGSLKDVSLSPKKWCNNKLCSSTSSPHSQSRRDSMLESDFWLSLLFLLLLLLLLLLFMPLQLQRVPPLRLPPPPLPLPESEDIGLFLGNMN